MTSIEGPTAAIAPASSYINRELSWLAFARRVLALAEDSRQPLLERVKFAGIMGMIYDEFAMKRMGGLHRQIAKRKANPGPDGLTPSEELRLCRAELRAQSRTRRASRRAGAAPGPRASGPADPRGGGSRRGAARTPRGGLPGSDRAHPHATGGRRRTSLPVHQQSRPQPRGRRARRPASPRPFRPHQGCRQTARAG